MCFILYDLYKYLKNLNWDYYQINEYFISKKYDKKINVVNENNDNTILRTRKRIREY